jgi:hypothetical protein
VQNSKLFFTSLATSLLLVSFHSLEAKAESTDNWLGQAVGNYPGKIWSGDGLIPGETEFLLNDDKSLIGSYSMQGQGLGVLSQCRAVRMLVARCIWHDRYGSGDLEVTFSENFSSFKGFWMPKGLTEKLPWNGKRQGT